MNRWHIGPFHLPEANPYLNHDIYHHPAQKRGMLLTLIESANQVADPEPLAGKLVSLCHILQNGSMKFEIEQAFKSYRRVKSQQDEDKIIHRVAAGD